MSPNPKPCLTRNDKEMRVEKKWEREGERERERMIISSFSFPQNMKEIRR
jgi:hypothetical protein